jgi:hypothetical protein
MALAKRNFCGTFAVPGQRVLRDIKGFGEEAKAQLSDPTSSIFDIADLLSPAQLAR